MSLERSIVIDEARSTRREIGMPLALFDVMGFTPCGGSDHGGKGKEEGRSKEEGGKQKA